MRIDPAPIFAALGDPTRLELVSRLSSGAPRSISQLSDGLFLTRQGVTKHLKILESAGIVASRRVGREQQFVFSPASIEEVTDYLEKVSEQWDEAINRLKAFVEND
jgi:DNA-binding transcriptional ArsR family regulator